MRVADYIAEHLEKIGVTHIFMLSGGGMMHLQDALSRRTALKYVCCHHEQSAAFAAESYARKKQSLGVCFATSGPGGLNTVTGIAQAWVDSTPVLFITGQAKTSDTIQGTKLFGSRQIGTFEADIVSIVKPITKYATFLDDPLLVRHHLEKAIKIATSDRPGPVLIDIPINVQGAPVIPEHLISYEDII